MNKTHLVAAPVRAWRPLKKGHGLTAAATKASFPQVTARVSAWMENNAPSVIHPPPYGGGYEDTFEVNPNPQSKNNTMAKILHIQGVAARRTLRFHHRREGIPRGLPRKKSRRHSRDARHLEGRPAGLRRRNAEREVCRDERPGLHRRAETGVGFRDEDRERFSNRRTSSCFRCRCGTSAFRTG